MFLKKNKSYSGRQIGSGKKGIQAKAKELAMF